MRSVNTVMRNYLIFSALLPVVLLCNSSARPKPTCTTAECKNRAALYAKNMQPDVNPCNDFYEFTCGNWSTQNPRPPYELAWTVRAMMHKETLDQLRNILTTPETSEDGVDLLCAKRALKVCMNIRSLGEGDVDFLVKNMDKVGFYPQTSVWDIHNGYVKLTGESPLFDIQIVANNEDNNEPVLQFKDIKSPFGSLVLLGTWNDEQKEAYLAFLVNLIKSLENRKQWALEEKTLIEIVEDVVNFRLDLNQITRASLAQESDPLEPMTVDDLQQWYNLNTNHTTTTQFNWDTIVRNLYSGQSDIALLANPTVGIRRKAYFIALAQLLAETSAKTLAYHFEIYFAEKHMIRTNSTQKILGELVSNVNGFAGYVRKEEMEKSLKCVEDISTDEAGGKIYVSNYFQKENIPAVESILKELRDAIKRDLTDSEQLNSEAKATSLRKISEIEWSVGYPPWYDNPKLKAESTLMRPATINANLEAGAHRLVVNAALMQSPLFGATLPDVINYGAIGTILGQEMYHALNDCPKLKNETAEVCTNLQMKDSKSTNQSSVEELPPASNAYNTTLHALGDALGLQAAYNAYQAKLKKQSNACASLPLFERFSCDQMFFISYANTMCGSTYANEGTLSSFRLRVNTALSNNEYFNKLFSCTPRNTRSSAKKFETPRVHPPRLG